MVLPSLEVCKDVITVTLGTSMMSLLIANAVQRANTDPRYKFPYLASYFRTKLAQFMAGVISPCAMYEYNSKTDLHVSFYIYSSMVSAMEKYIVDHDMGHSFGPADVYQNVLLQLNVFCQAVAGTVTLNAFDMYLAQFRNGMIALMYGPVPLDLVALPSTLGTPAMLSLTQTIWALIKEGKIPRITGTIILVHASGVPAFEGISSAVSGFMSTLHQLTCTTLEHTTNLYVDRRNRGKKYIILGAYSLMWMIWGLYKLVFSVQKPVPPQWDEHDIPANEGDDHLTTGFTENTSYTEPTTPPAKPEEPEIPITSGNIDTTLKNLINQAPEPNTKANMVVIGLLAPIIVLFGLVLSKHKTKTNKRSKP